MRVIVGCEFSGRVRGEFAKRGHDAWSCDLLPTEVEGQHIQGDIIEVLNNPRKHGKFDIGIFHPECTYLAKSGVRWLSGGTGDVRDEKRWKLMRQAAQFFKTLLNCKIPRVCVENPIMHRYAKELIGAGHTQIIQPWQFGHGETKATCLWLRNLPALQPTNIV